jgi:hypothetical protein
MCRTEGDEPGRDFAYKVVTEPSTKLAWCFDEEQRTIACACARSLGVDVTKGKTCGTEVLRDGG